MEVQPDFRELLALFYAYNVECMIVGGYALALRGAPRLTGDLDIFVRPTTDNTRRILAASNDFRFGSLNLTAGDFSTQDRVVQLGVAPVRVDRMMSLSGVSWENCFEGRQPGAYGEVPVTFIGREQFIANKRAIGRLQELADLEALGGT